MMTTVKIGTLNTRGGGNKTERIIKVLKNNGNDVTCMQEMHEVSAKSKQTIEKQCKGKLYTNNGTSQSRGVATFIRDRDDLESSVVCADSTGRLLAIKMWVGKCVWTVYNLYAPNDICQRADFFSEVSREMESGQGKIIVTGDFNCTIDRNLDRTNNHTKGAMKADRSRQALRDLMEKYNLVDTYRRLHPFGTAYSFTGPNGYRARLDRVYADQDSTESLDQSTLQAVSFSDHDMVSASFGKEEENLRWGRGRWMLNTKLLYDQETREELSECVQYCRRTKVNFANILQWWDHLKEKMREILIRNGKRVQRERKRERVTLETELNILICKPKTTATDTNRIRELKNKLEDIEKEQEEGCRVRSKENWIDKSEHCARYFYDEEKRKGKLRVIESVLDEKGDLKTSKEDICETIRTFYEKLLTRENLEESEMKLLVDRYISKQLSDNERDSIEGVITKAEILKALKEMKNNKSPGLDGLPREFYVMMWPEIGNDLSDVIANICLRDELPQSWTEGLVSIMYKEKGDSRDLKNWRPITLLNVDYKIMTKAISNRIRKVSNNLVNPDQSCGLPGRNIHDQLYFIRDFYQHFNETNKTGILICIDQEKCFDRIDHRLIHVLMNKFNFGPTIKSLIKTIYANMQSKILINGLITEPLTVSRSVRQGDGLSMSLAVLVGELLGEMIRRNQEIPPICLPNSLPKKVSQYADDTSIVTDNPRCLNSLWKTIEKYERVTGSRVNQSKTEVLLVGKWSKKKRSEIGEKYRKLVKESIKILGVHFGKNAEALNEGNMKEKIDGELEKWKDRNLSMRGKIAILRTLVTSKIWHVAKVTSLRRSFITKMTAEMVRFFWYPKNHHPLNLRILQNDVNRGGQNLPNIQLEMETYFIETVSLAANNPEKPWVGMTRYRHGAMLKGILPEQKNTEITKKQSVTSKNVQNALQKLEGKIQNWNKMNYSKFLVILKENVPVEGREEDWRNIKNSSKNLKRADLNYKIAHGRLPLAEFLERKNITGDNKCRLCRKDPETHLHLFYECQTIQETKMALIVEIKRIDHKFGGLTFEFLTWHKPKVAQKINELLSVFKQCIWLTRSAVYYDKITDIKTHLHGLFLSKLN